MAALDSSLMNSVDPAYPVTGNSLLDFGGALGPVDPTQYNGTISELPDNIYTLDGSNANTDTTATAEVSSETNQENLNFAAEWAIRNAGLEGHPKSEWTQAGAVAYITNFRQFILDNPQLFTGDTYAMALHINLNRPDYADPIGNIADIGVAITDFIAPAVDAIAPIAQTPSKLADLMNASITALNNAAGSVASSKLLTLLLLGGLAIFALSKASGPIQDVKRIFR
jgi:hypothetical protein